MMKKAILAIFIIIISVGFSINAFAIDFDMDELCNSVVVVRTNSTVGSGFAIAKDKIITNQHVVSTTTTYVIETNDGALYNGRLIASDESKDLSLVEVLGGNLPTIPMTEGVPPLGTDVYAVGSPQGMSFSVSRGVLSTADREVNGIHYIQTDAAINPGNSGGPLLNQVGQVIGVNNMKVEDVDRISLAVPMTSVVEFLQENGVNVQLSGAADEELESPDSVVVQKSASDDAEESYEQYSNNLRNQYTTILKTVQNENIILIIGLIVIAVLCFIFMLVMLSQKDKLKRSTRNLDKAIDALKMQSQQIKRMQELNHALRRTKSDGTEQDTGRGAEYRVVSQTKTAFVSHMPRRYSSEKPKYGSSKKSY